LTLFLWLGPLGVVVVGGAVFRSLRGDSDAAGALVVITFGLLMLVGGLLSLGGRFLLAVPILLYQLLSLITLFIPAIRPETAETGPEAGKVAVAALSAFGLAWVAARRYAGSRAGSRVARVACLLLVIAFAVAVPDLGRRMGVGIGMIVVPPARMSTLAEGQRLPDVRFRTLDGSWTRAEEPGTLYVINFWATWCGPCRLELPALMDMWVDLEQEGRIQLMAVNTEELPPDSIVAFLKKENLEGLPVFTIEDGDKQLLGVETIPLTLVVLDRQLLLRDEGFAPGTIPDLKRFLRRLLRPGSLSG
jgi:thiol-disulfide isomerase/thioredoxin